MKTRFTFSIVLMLTVIVLLLGLSSTARLARADRGNFVGPLATVQDITVRFRGVDRPVSYYVPTSYSRGTPVPLLFFLHGGSQDSSVWLDPARNVLDYAEAQEFIAVFPNGLPRPDAAPGSTSYFWEDPVNIPYQGYLIDLMISNFTIDTRRVYFIGFSGGAKTCYRLAVDRKISPRIAAIATMAGEFGQKAVAPADAPWEIIDPVASGGTPMSALLLQGRQ